MPGEHNAKQMKKLEMTENQKKAYDIIKNNEPIGPYQFAKLMWPDSKMHNQSLNKINRYSLSYLYKMKNRCFIENVGKYTFKTIQINEESA